MYADWDRVLPGLAALSAMCGLQLQSKKHETSSVLTLWTRLIWQQDVPSRVVSLSWKRSIISLVTRRECLSCTTLDTTSCHCSRTSCLTQSDRRNSRRCRAVCHMQKKKHGRDRESCARRLPGCSQT